jgi:hypothetical protein
VKELDSKRIEFFVEDGGFDGESHSVKNINEASSK